MPIFIIARFVQKAEMKINNQLKKSVKYIQNAAPFRQKEIYVVIPK